MSENLRASPRGSAKATVQGSDQRSSQPEARLHGNRQTLQEGCHPETGNLVFMHSLFLKNVNLEFIGHRLNVD